MQRLYPDAIPPFPNEPLSEDFAITKADGFGEGLVTQRPFKAGEIVFTFAGEIVRELTLFTLQMEPGLHIHDPYVMGKVLHSCDPNMECHMDSLTFYARRDIKAGELLTMDYETTEDELYRSFICKCGSPQCKGLIRGRLFRNGGQAYADAESRVSAPEISKNN